jgi:Ca2+-binding RTX toxin-like protein
MHRGSIKRALIVLGVAVGGVFAASPAADAAVTATFTANAGVLSVFGDGLANTIAVSRDGTGAILVNGGAVRIAGGASTVANTTLIQVFGQAGSDVLALSEANGALPAANLIGGGGDDTLTGGSGADQLFGQAGKDTLLGKGGNDTLLGGDEADTLTGGDADDKVFGQAGNDRLVWSPGDDTDLNEGGDGADTVEVNGGNGTEQFTATANGTRVRFDRISPAPFTLDIGTTEQLELSANGGDDTFTGSNGLATLITLTVDGGPGNDALSGGDGADVLRGGDGDDVVLGKRGNDIAFLGAGDDAFQWAPGDGSDVVEGQDGTDGLAFDGANVAEKIALSPNGSRALLTRDIANIVMDLNGLETVDVEAVGGADTVTVNDLTGTGVATVIAAVGTPANAEDSAPDTVFVNGTAGDDVATVAGAGAEVDVLGLPTRIAMLGGFAPNDHLIVGALAGDDVLDAFGLTAGAPRLTLDGGDGDDILIGGDGDDTLLGGAGDDVLIGGPGDDVLDGGAGNNVVLDDLGTNAVTSAAVADRAWKTAHVEVADGKSVVTLKGKAHALPRAALGPST